MPLRLYNTLTRKEEDFVPLHEGVVGLYCCGPTVYDYPHIGHAKLYVAVDAMVRYLRWSGYRVKHVMNITDVGHLTDNADDGEDKILRKATAERLDPMEVAETYTWAFFDDMAALGVARPNVAPKASGHVPEQIELIKTLIAKGHAYEAGGSVYFDISTWPDYGKLSGRDPSEMEAGARVAVDSNKRNPGDFLLWRQASPEHILRWPSPWGEGYPGWHLECSAMTKRYLGDTFDIHAGGLENMFPHNEDEVAQSEAANEAPFARYWVHINSLTVGGKKMGKSLGNAIWLREALEKWSAEAIRFFILSIHYRSVLDVTDEALDAAQTGQKRLDNAYKALVNARPSPEGRSLEGEIKQARQRFVEAMDSDFNTSAAIAALFDLVRETNGALASGGLDEDSIAAAGALLAELGAGVLGIVGLEQSGGAGDIGPKLMEILISTRAMLRRAKQFEMADSIRTELSGAGIELEDRPGETVWRRED